MPADEVPNIILERLNLVLDRINVVEKAQQLVQSDLLSLTNAEREHAYGLAAKVDSLRGYMQNRSESESHQRSQYDALMRRLDEALERIAALEAGK